MSGGIPAADVSDDVWPGLLSTVARERLTGLALAAVEDGELELTLRQTQELLERHKAAMWHALQLESRLVGIAEAFDAADVGMLVLKGPALAHDVYPDPSWRPFGDIDVLVRTRDWEKAADVLFDVGFSPKYPEPRPGFRARFGHTACHVDATGFELDLHRTLVAGPFGLWMDPDELFERTTAFVLGGREFRRLEDSSAFVHACLHACLGHRPPLLLPVRDVAQLVSGHDIDWTLMADWGSRWNLGVVIQHAIEMTTQLLGFDVPEPARDFLRSQTPPRRARRALEAYTGDRRLRGGIAISSLWAIHGLRSKAAYVRALALPDASFRRFRERKTGWASIVARWSKPGRWLVRR